MHSHVLLWYPVCNGRIPSDHRFDEPEGNAIKVFESDVSQQPSFQERLWHFWQRGE
ncbi:hypothetical protein JCM19037_571 [Geomicrobium sp. JCM 19037]|nr:hypothetical protein JCM19037_571 [Geomicrobium sp. JCM 19037]